MHILPSHYTPCRLAPDRQQNDATISLSLRGAQECMRRPLRLDAWSWPRGGGLSIWGRCRLAAQAHQKGAVISYPCICVQDSAVTMPGDETEV